MEQTTARLTGTIEQQYRMIHNLYVLLDDGDRRILQPLGLTIPQYRVLLLLNQQDGLRLTTLSEHLIRAKSTITRIIDQLERQGLVTRSSDLEDRRAQRVLLTDAGASLMEKACIAQENMLTQR
ncbi:MarR family winged helix-turn-helix transcriptional regulator, partial [Chloroflexota bacterium]